MKEYVNLLFSIIDKIDNWEFIKDNEKKNILKSYIDSDQNFDNLVKYSSLFYDLIIKRSFFADAKYLNSKTNKILAMNLILFLSYVIGSDF